MEFLETSKYIGEDGHKFFCNIYLAKIDSKTDFKLQEEEVEALEKWSAKKIKS